ncbi:major histocompatibility complex class I-related gene protein-like [Pempheris klunzingeri]|uniref:major histocompatibility complex class I-related gene protein-like n=1 Tax=Pempheris klunzingeri TaxID=3127111 RepID=UPI0039808244
MKKAFVLLVLSHFASTVKHSMKYFFTESSGVPDFPEFVGVALVDEVQVGHCDSNIRRVEFKLDWVKKIVDDDPHLLEWHSQECITHHYFLKHFRESLKQRLNKTGDISIVQQMAGCEWDDETGEVVSFNQYSYDGEDFIALDLKTMTWIAPKPQAVLTKHKWDSERAQLNFIKIYLTEQIPEWLKKGLDYGKSFLLRTDLPKVSLLQKSPSSPVTCHATGFYPNAAMMFWRKGGEEHHEGVTLGEILPNNDGSFQTSVDLKAPGASEDWGSYECVFQLSGLKDDIVTKLDKAVIRTNWVSPSELSAGPVIGVVVGLLLLLALCIAGLFNWKRNNHGNGERCFCSSRSHFHSTVSAQMSD